MNELVTRATQIEKLLEERAWRESLLDAGKSARIEVEGEDEGDDESKGMVRIMSDIFYAAAKVFLATVVNGPFPRGTCVRPSLEKTLMTSSRDCQLGNSYHLCPHPSRHTPPRPRHQPRTHPTDHSCRLSCRVFRAERLLPWQIPAARTGSRCVRQF